MNVEVIYRTDPERPLYDPLPEKNGVVFRLLRGHVVRPLFGNWFHPPYPSFVLRFETRIWIPFFAWRLWGWTGYVGGKVFSADAHPAYGYLAYREWMAERDIGPGSMAICPSVRPFAKPE